MLSLLNVGGMQREKITFVNGFLAGVLSECGESKADATDPLHQVEPVFNQFYLRTEQSLKCEASIRSKITLI